MANKKTTKKNYTKKKTNSNGQTKKKYTSNKKANTNQVKKANTKKTQSNLSNEELLNNILTEKKIKLVAKEKVKTIYNYENEQHYVDLKKQQAEKAKIELEKKKKQERLEKERQIRRQKEIELAAAEQKKLKEEQERLKKEKEELEKTAEIISIFELQPNKKQTKKKKVIVKRNKKKKKLKKEIERLIAWIIVIIVGLGILFGLLKITTKVKEIIPSNNITLKSNVEDIEKAKLEEEYNNCLTRKSDEKDETEEVLNAKEELTSYIQNNYKASVAYEDLTTGFNYTYNASENYYAASAIKALDALYIYEKASTGEINLDETITYTAKYKWDSSKEMSKKSYGEKVSLRDLVKYAVTVSDNTAHQMLISYIGKSTLKEYAKSLGATSTLIGGDNFGQINVSDAIIYMKAINEFINNNEELGSELKSYFVEAELNGLELEDLGIKAAHKYGEYSPYFHDYGIVYAENPYVVAILTTEYKGDHLAKVQDISKKIYELHELYQENRKNICNEEVYN